MLQCKMRYLVAIGLVLIVAQEAAAWPRLRHHRCTCPFERQSPMAVSTTAPSAEVTGLLTTEAEKAKSALLRLIRSDRKLFVGNPDPDRLERIAVSCYDAREPQMFSWGAFVIDVKQRTYNANIGEEAIEVWFYSGTFQVNASGQWTAIAPKVTQALALPKRE